MHTGIFPEPLKMSKVVPLYNTNDQIILSNYRPIALLPSLSKIFEYVLLEQLTNYFVENNLLFPHQYVSCAKHSTELTALIIVDNLSYEFDSGLIPINIYLDLSKAFDTLLHEMLLDKMSYHGVNGVANDLLRSYLIQRQQIVEFNVFFVQSSRNQNWCPSGVSSGIIFFSIYINDLLISTNLFKMIMYADDTMLFCDIYNIKNLGITLNAKLFKITE